MSVVRDPQAATRDRGALTVLLGAQQTRRVAPRRRIGVTSEGGSESTMIFEKKKIIISYFNLTQLPSNMGFYSSQIYIWFEQGFLRPESE